VTYTAERRAVDGIETVRLTDRAHETEVSIAPTVGNMAYETIVHGRNILWSPYTSLGELRERPALCGIPFLGPWANRIDHDAYRANGREYRLNPELGNIRRDGNQKPIHGLLNFSPLWQVVAVDADERSASVTSRIEFWRHPAHMAQFPFAHNLTMTYRVAHGVLEVETAIENLSAETLPVAVGYHPYFRLHDTPRDSWRVHLAARDRMELDEFLIPTGEVRASEFADPYPLSGTQLDDVFTTLDEPAQFWVEGEKEKITVTYGPKYPVAVVYAPQGKDFICFEPMSAPTNAFNADKQQNLEPGATWKESFWIETSGF
jgi:aldose 1-epimerase